MFAPKAIEVFRRTLDDDRLGEANRLVFVAPVFAACFLANLAAAHQVDDGHAGDGSGGHGHPAPPRIRRSERPTEQRQVHDVAADARPHPCGRFVLHQNADSRRDLAHAHGTQQGTVGWNPDQLGDGSRSRELRKPKPDTEPAQRLRMSGLPAPRFP